MTSAAAMQPAISVIIPAHNEAHNLPRTLAALTRQTLEPSRFEVLVVDDRSTDGTLALAASFAGQLPLRAVSTSSGSIAAVRNHGASLARGDVLAFLDADCVPRPDWLAEALQLAAPHTLWGADYLIPPDSTWVGRVWARFQATEHRGPTAFLPGGCLFVSRAGFDRLGGFQTSLETSEDVELCRRAHQQHGFAVIAWPQLAVFHYGTPQTLAAFYRQNRWHGKHVLRAFLQLPSPRTGALLGLSLYMLLAFWCGLFAFLAGLLRANWLLAGTALLPLLLPPVTLALVRGVSGRKPALVPALSLLYLVYLLARAAALVQAPTRGIRT